MQIKYEGGGEVATRAGIFKNGETKNIADALGKKLLCNIGFKEIKEQKISKAREDKK